MVFAWTSTVIPLPARLAQCKQRASSVCVSDICRKQDMSVDDENTAVVEAMRPFAASDLGWFCLGYNLTDAPGRPQAILALLTRSSVAPAASINLREVTRVLRRLEQRHHRWIGLPPGPFASATPLATVGGRPSELAVAVTEWYAYAGPSVCKCGEPLRRWREQPASFMTLARGMVVGRVIFLRCFSCSSVYSGRWSWCNVTESSPFPDGHHHPRLSGQAAHASRWFSLRRRYVGISRYWLSWWGVWSEAV